MTEEEKEEVLKTQPPIGTEVEEGVETSPEAPEDIIDYEEELKMVEKLAPVLDELDRSNRDRDNYQKGMMKAKAKLKEEDGEETSEINIAELVAQEVAKKMSALQGNFTKNIEQTVLADMSTNAAEQRLIKWHYENSIQKTGVDPASVRNDMENAKMIANKKLLFKKQNEMSIALQNRSQLSSSTTGASQDKPEVKTNFFGKDQINHFKKLGWDDAKIKRAEENYRKATQRVV